MGSAEKAVIYNCTGAGLSVKFDLMRKLSFPEKVIIRMFYLIVKDIGMYEDRRWIEDVHKNRKESKNGS